MQLTQTEIDRRLQRLRNLECLYVEQREQNIKLRAENRSLKQRVKELEERDKEKDLRITELSLHMGLSPNGTFFGFFHFSTV